MYLTEITQLKAACLHHIGHRSTEEGVLLSNEILRLDDISRKNLFTYCFSSFKDEEKFCFTNEIGLEYNETMACIKSLFSNPNQIVDVSQQLAKILYGKSEHPGIKSGDFIVVYFSDCELNGIFCDAIGLYKCENSTSFLSLLCDGRKAEVLTLQGFDLRHVDKAALIFNTNGEDGYKLSVIDNTNKNEAKYWIDDFLQAKPCSDEYRQTRSMLGAAKNYIYKALSESKEISKGEQAELLDRAMRYFRENETFDMADFGDKVMEDEQLSADFGQFVESYMTKNDMASYDSFDISQSAVKKSSRSMKSVIKLDKNFHIYIHGGEGMIKRGFDEATGLEYYQLYFQKEE